MRSESRSNLGALSQENLATTRADSLISSFSGHERNTSSASKSRRPGSTKTSGNQRTASEFARKTSKVPLASGPPDNGHTTSRNNSVIASFSRNNSVMVASSRSNSISSGDPQSRRLRRQSGSTLSIASVTTGKRSPNSRKKSGLLGITQIPENQPPISLLPQKTLSQDEMNLIEACQNGDIDLVGKSTFHFRLFLNLSFMW
jgi:hypothetical protein